MKTILSLGLSFLLVLQCIYFVPLKAKATEIQSVTDTATKEQTDSEETSLTVEAPSAVLMEVSTGQIIYEKSAQEKLAPASVTKIMTLVLIFDAISKGKITLEDKVKVSEYASSMGGSQVFLEPGEEQTVDTMIKCIAVASANDACVAMAEHVAGNEEEFVKQMNARAVGLGMEHTNFINCNGLDAENHVTTALDIARMSRELISKYPQIRGYSMIWMENITHTTSKGSSEFGLTNTNKLVRQYEYTTGLKTGSTDLAKFCISATAKKDDMEMIAVIMAAPDPKTRILDATNLLNYGFAKCKKYIDSESIEISTIKIQRGVKDTAKIKLAEQFQYIDTTGADLNTIQREVVLLKGIKAPVKLGDELGNISYYLGETLLGSAKIIADENIMKMNYKSALMDVMNSFFL